MNTQAVAIALLQREQRYFLQRRSPLAMVFPGLWEFPGGKVEVAESPLEALIRELGEELGWRPARVLPLPRFIHAYKEFEVVLHPFHCSGDFLPRTNLAWGWFLAPEILGLPVLEATGRLVAQTLLAP